MIKLHELSLSSMSPYSSMSSYSCRAFFKAWALTNCRYLPVVRVGLIAGSFYDKVSSKNKFIKE